MQLTCNSTDLSYILLFSKHFRFNFLLLSVLEVFQTAWNSNNLL